MATSTAAAADAPPGRPQPQPADPPGERSRTGPVEPLLYLVAATLASVVAAVTLRLQDAAWSVPLVYVGDAVAVHAHAKTVLETGWYESQPALGAPAGQQYHEFPTAENLHMMAFRVLGWFLDDSAAGMNAYFLLGFPLAAITGLWFLRRCGVSRAPAVALAVLFAVLPYHFERSESHLFLASYWTMPPALALVVLALRGEPLWGRRTQGRGAGRWTSWLLGRGALTVAAMALLGTSSTYYSVFVALLLATAGILALVRDRHLGRFLGAAGAGVALVATMLANMAPDLLYARSREPNVLALTRLPEHAEFFALKPVQLVLPSALHRFGPLRALRREYNETFPLPSESPALGLVAAAGLVLLLVVVAVAAVRPALARARPLAELSVLTLVALLSATVGGLSSLIAVLLTDALRGWARMTVVIALLALAGVGLAVDLVVDVVSRARSAGRRRPRLRPAVAVVAAAGLLAVGTVDQTSPLYQPPYAATAASYASDGAYVSALETDLPADAMVFQLPYIAFPESPDTNGVLYTDQLRMYLHSTDLRWSAGGLRGRPTADWAELAAARDTAVLVPQLAVAGFAGVHVDGRAYADGGAAVAEVLTGRLGEPTRTSDDDRYRFWPLAGVLDDVRATTPEPALARVREAVLQPVVPYLAPDFTGPGLLDGRRFWNSVLSSGDVLLDNPRGTPAQVRLSFSVGSPSGDAAVEVTLPGQQPQRLDLDGGEAQVDVDLTLAPGRSRVHLAPAPDLLDTGAASLAASRFHLVDVTVEDPVLTAFVP